MFFYKMVLIMISSMCSFLSQADKSSVEAGAEIYINYGNKGNEVLLTLICVDLELFTTNVLFLVLTRFPLSYLPICHCMTWMVSLSHIFLSRPSTVF
jgi:hypothetical protein